MANLFIGDAYLGRRGRQKCLKMSIRYMNGPIGIIFNRLKEKKMLLYKSKQHRELRQKTPTSMNFNLQDNVSNFIIYIQ